jgi:hypothetical protein
MRKRTLLLVVMLVVFGTQAAWGLSLNNDPLTPDPAPVLGAGWTYDQINQAFAPSVDSPYIFTLGAPAYLYITDYFNTGDTYFVYDSSNLILTTSLLGAMPSLPLGDPLGNAGWTNPIYSKGFVLLGAGLHNLDVQGNGLGGLSAGFYTALVNPVPEPATLTLFGLGAGALVLLRRRKRV